MAPLLVVTTFLPTFFTYTMNLMLGIFIAYAIVRWKSRPKTHIVAEYWVYLGSKDVPSQDDVMTWLMKSNPVAGFSTKEALLFSDVRVRITAVNRAKNVSAFRPDLFIGGSLTTAQIASLAHCQQFVKIKFGSEEPTKDRRYLTFLTHVAAAYANFGDAALIYDCVLAKPWSPEEFMAMLKEEPDASAPDIHTDIVWRQAGDSVSAETVGMTKIGLPDILAEGVSADMRVLTESLLRSAIKMVWLESALPETIEVESYGDTFAFRFPPAKNGFTHARVSRIQGI